MSNRLKRFTYVVQKYLLESSGLEPQYHEFNSFVSGSAGKTIVRFYLDGHWEIVDGPLRAEANSFLECVEQLN